MVPLLLALRRISFPEDNFKEEKKGKKYIYISVVQSIETV